MVLLERGVASRDQVGPHLGGTGAKRNTRLLAADSGDLGSESVQLDLQREVLTVQSHRVGWAAVAGESAETIHETDEQVVEGELERSEEELGHVQPVSLTCRPGAIDGQFGWDFELFGSTGPAWSRDGELRAWRRVHRHVDEPRLFQRAQQLDASDLHADLAPTHTRRDVTPCCE